MAPTVMIGDQVILLVEPDDNNGSPYAPAFVTRVYAGGVLNVRPLRDLPGEVELCTGIQLFDSHADALAAQEQFKANARLTNRLPDDAVVKLAHPIAAFPKPGSAAPAPAGPATDGSILASPVPAPEPEPEIVRTPPPAEVPPTFA